MRPKGGRPPSHGTKAQGAGGVPSSGLVLAVFPGSSGLRFL